MQEYEHGVQVADSCMIRDLSKVFSWKRGFQNCFTGFPNDGKTTGSLYLMVVKAILSDWKFVIWSPEMRTGTFQNGKVRIHYNDLINEVIWILTGMTPYLHISQRDNTPRLKATEYVKWIPWVRDHFITIHPKDRTPTGIRETLTKIYEYEGYDGIFIDPFKNVKQDQVKIRDDIWLEDVFGEFKELSIETNSVMNWIAHPKSGVPRYRKDGDKSVRVPCNQTNLNGGAAWDNSMDGIYTWFRPSEEPNDTRAEFINYKQRKQDLTTLRGTCTGIDYSRVSKRYTFGGLDPLQDVKI